MPTPKRSWLGKALLNEETRDEEAALTKLRRKVSAEMPAFNDLVAEITAQPKPPESRHPTG